MRSAGGSYIGIDTEQTRATAAALTGASVDLDDLAASVARQAWSVGIDAHRPVATLVRVADEALTAAHVLADRAGLAESITMPALGIAHRPRQSAAQLARVADALLTGRTPQEAGLPEGLFPPDYVERARRIDDLEADPRRPALRKQDVVELEERRRSLGVDLATAVAFVASPESGMPEADRRQITGEVLHREIDARFEDVLDVIVTFPFAADAYVATGSIDDLTRLRVRSQSGRALGDLLAIEGAIAAVVARRSREGTLGFTGEELVEADSHNTFYLNGDAHPAFILGAATAALDGLASTFEPRDDRVPALDAVTDAGLGSDLIERLDDGLSVLVDPVFAYGDLGAAAGRLVASVAGDDRSVGAVMRAIAAVEVPGSLDPLLVEGAAAMVAPRPLLLHSPGRGHIDIPGIGVTPDPARRHLGVEAEEVIDDFYAELHTDRNAAAILLDATDLQAAAAVTAAYSSDTAAFTEVAEDWGAVLGRLDRYRVAVDLDRAKNSDALARHVSWLLSFAGAQTRSGLDGSIASRLPGGPAAQFARRGVLRLVTGGAVDRLALPDDNVEQFLAAELDRHHNDALARTLVGAQLLLGRGELTLPRRFLDDDGRLDVAAAAEDVDGLRDAVVDPDERAELARLEGIFGAQFAARVESAGSPPDP